MKKVKYIFHGMDKPLLIITIILFLFGLLNIVTASSQATVVHLKNSVYDYFFNQSIYLLVGLVLSIIILKFPTKSYQFWGNIAFIVVAILALLVSFNGKDVGGNKNWLPILGGRFSLQPSEFAKPVVIVCLSIYFEKFYRKLRTTNVSHLKIIGWLLFVGLFFPFIVCTQKDMGTTLVLLAIFAVMFWYSPILNHEKLKIVGILGGLGIALVLLIMTIFPNKILTKSQLSRIGNFWDPCSRYEETGYQICNGYIAINSGGLLGVGIGESKQKSYIPESHTDSVFAIIAEEYGFLISTFILLCYLYILYRILKLASISYTIRGRYLCLGIATYLFLHIIINLGGLFGVMPLTGIPLPFLSYGGSYTISLIVALSIVQRVSIEIKNRRIRIS